MERTVTIRDIKVTVRELTVADVRAWIKQMSEGVAFDLVGDGLFQEENGSLHDVLVMTDLDANEAEQMTPAEISTILEKCRKVNPHFFILRRGIVRETEVVPLPSDSSSPTA